MSIRLVLADDHPLILNALENLFRLEPDFAIVARCQDGQETLQAVLRSQPDILVLDIRMPRVDGLMVLRELQTRRLPTRVVLLTAALEDEEVLEAIRLGVRGVVLKEMAPQLLIQCIRQVHAGEQWLERHTMNRALDTLLRRETRRSELQGKLTPRELDIVRMIVSGLRNKEIAKKLWISEGTVKIHLHNIYEKLEITSRLELFRYAQERGFV